VVLPWAVYVQLMQEAGPRRQGSDMLTNVDIQAGNRQGTKEGRIAAI
jgi:hypothetical protein